MNPGWRIGVLGVVFTVAFSVLGLRLWVIQVTKSDEYTEQAKQNQVRLVPTPAPRGDIYDRKGRLLAGTRPSLAAVVDLALVDEDAQMELAHQLGAFLDRPTSEIQDRLDTAAAGSVFVLAEDLTDLQALTLSEHREDFPGVAVIPQPVRDYPLGDLGAHILGYIGKPSEEDLEREGVKGTDVVGKAGVERVYDDLLRGTEGTILYRVDARRNVLAREDESPPAPGANLVLTLDADVQRRLQDSLMEGLALARRTEMEDRSAALAAKPIPQRLQEAVAALAQEQADAAAADDASETDVGEPLAIDEGEVLGPLYQGLPVDEEGVCVPVQRVDMEPGAGAVLTGATPRPVSLLEIAGDENRGFRATISVAGEEYTVENGDEFAVTLRVVELTEAAIVIHHRDRYCPVRAVGVVLDPNNGDVVAMASYPGFEPAAFVGGLSLEQWRELGSLSAFTNFAVQGLYSPASTLKAVAYVMAMEDGVYPYERPDRDRTVADPDSDEEPLVPLRSDTDKYNCTGEFVFELNDGTVQRMRDWKTGGHGPLDLHEALRESCDLYFWDIATRIWNERADESGLNNENLWQEWARRFGLGALTGIDLPFEKAGLIPDRQWFIEEQAKGTGRVRAEGPWVGGDLMNAIVGQGEVLVTPLQLANAFAAMINGGTVWQPRVVAAVQDQEGNTLQEAARRPILSFPLSPSTAASLRNDLHQVVADGTASSAFVGFGANLDQVGGKTGTGEVVKADEDVFEIDNAWFVGLAGIDDPEYVVAVVVERGGSGGGIAAPVARQVLQFLLNGPDGVTPQQRGATAD